MRVLPTLTALAAVLTATISAPSAGTVSLQWNPSTGAAGYKVFYGASAGGYGSQMDAGSATQATISGLSDCTTWYFAVKAYDAGGNLSTTYSNEVSGWPRPAVTAVTPTAVEQGRRLSLTIDGSNFKTGAALTFSAPGVTVHSVSVQSCNRLTADVTIGATAPAGSADVDVMNTDRTFGVRTGGLTIQAAAAPTVASTSPASGATGVATTVQPTVTFSEAVLPTSVLASTVRLLDETGAAVPLASGFPALSSDGRTVTLKPAAALTIGKAYRIQAVGGSAGVLDLAGHGLASTYTQSPGFTTQADTTAPAISGVGATSVTASGARIVWTTSEASDSQVFYRKQGTTAYQQTAVDSALVTSHAVNLSGLAAGTVYQFHVRSADAAGNASTTSPDGSFTTTASGATLLRVEVEDGALTSPVRTISGAGAFDGGWVDTPTGSATGSESAPTGTATLDVYVPTAGTWTLWVRVYAQSVAADSWFESVDGAPRQALIAPEVGSWVWAPGRAYTLAAGLHRIELGGREAQTRADRILLVNDATYVPAEVPGTDTLSPLPLASLAASPGDGSNGITWKASPSSDHVKTVIRYRTDGVSPRTPADGFPLVDQAGSPSSTGSYTHGGLTNGTTYRYAAFSLDAAGNASNPTAVSATPGTSGGRPSKVRNNRRK